MHHWGRDPEQEHFVSTGRLPVGERVQDLVSAAYERYRSRKDGHVSTVYPALARVSPELFGICVLRTDGRTFVAGDCDVEFAIMSVAKPFVFALVCELLGSEPSRERLGVNATGLPFNSLASVEQAAAGRTNPMVNSGAIVTTSLVPGGGLEERWRFVVNGLSQFAGRDLHLDDEMYASASLTNQRNRSMAWLLESLGALAGDPVAAVDLYTRQSCLEVTARDLAVMGATLADGGVNPVTGQRVVSAETCRHVLAVMATAGLYESSGDWLYSVGLPGKSGIGGGIVTAAPGKGGMGTYGPLLDEFGNSIKGQLATYHLSSGLGLNLFVSEPARADLSHR
jgi:glutaminase